VSDEVKGTINIVIKENKLPSIKFTGNLTGAEMDLAWKSMMKEYRVWKNTLIVRDTKQGDTNAATK